MKKISSKIALPICASVLFLATSTMAQAKSVNYNKGFCVLLGTPLHSENAIVRVDEKMMNDQYIIGFFHEFFNFKSGRIAIHAADWAGESALIKIAEGAFPAKNVAVFIANSHVFPSNNPKLVECIASDLVEEEK